MIRYAPGLLLIAFDVFCLIDVIVSRDDEVRNLPKIVWFLLILFLPVIGGVIWLVAGRPTSRLGSRSPYERTAPAYPEYDRPGRAAGLSPESDEEFLRKVRERAEEQRRIAAEQRREQERAEEAERERRKKAREDGEDVPEV